MIKIYLFKLIILLVYVYIVYMLGWLGVEVLFFSLVGYWSWFYCFYELDVYVVNYYSIYWFFRFMILYSVEMYLCEMKKWSLFFYGLCELFCYWKFVLWEGIW